MIMYGNSIDVTLHQKLFNINLGYRYYYSSFFGGLGLYYGIPVGTWEMEIKDPSGSHTEKTKDNFDISGEFGISLELGASFPVMDNMYIDILGKYMFAMNNILKTKTEGTEIKKMEFKNPAMLIQLGVNYLF